MYDINKHELGEIKELITLAQKYLWRNDDCMRILQDNGIHIVRGDFYSPIPTLAEIDSSWENSAIPPYLTDQYDNDFMCDFLEKELIPYADEFDPPLNNPKDPSVFFWNNSQFSYSDAMAYYCMIRAKKPNKIVEIGAGNSTLVALEAVKRNGFGEIVCVEPFPGAHLRAIESKITLIESPVQSSTVATEIQALRENDILFIDSTHTVKVGGDCLYIYLVLLPMLGHGVHVQVHDIFLPYMFPKSNLVLQQYWTEQYLLGAYLLDNDHVKIMYGSYYHYLNNRKLLDIFMGGKYQSGGASFYFSMNRKKSRQPDEDLNKPLEAA